MRGIGPVLTRLGREICPAGLDKLARTWYGLHARLAAAPEGATLLSVHGARGKPLGLIDQAAFFWLPLTRPPPRSYLILGPQSFA